VPAGGTGARAGSGAAAARLTPGSATATSAPPSPAGFFFACYAPAAAKEVTDGRYRRETDRHCAPRACLAPRTGFDGRAALGARTSP
jgi:hypothetical protein